MFNKKLTKQIISLNKRQNEKYVLIATGFAGYSLAKNMDILLGLGFLNQNYNVSYLICDKSISVCTLTKINDLSIENLISEDFVEQPRCKNCFNKKHYNHLEELGFNIFFFSDYISNIEVNDINLILKNNSHEDLLKFSFGDGINLGHIALSNTLRFLAKGSLENEIHAHNIFKRFLFSTLITYFSYKNYLKKNKIDLIVMNHGIYSPHGILNEVSKKERINIYTWIAAYRRGTFLFSKGDTYHQTMPKENPKQLNSKISFIQKLILTHYMNSKTKGDKDWIFFNRSNKKSNFKNIYKELLLQKYDYLLLTNVIWDAKSHYPDNAFESMMDWVLITIDYFIKKNKKLMIRVHPAEKSGAIVSREQVVEQIFKKYEHIPQNIKIFDADSGIDTYKLIKISKIVLVHSTKASIEAAYFGKKVIVAGEAWIKNKGISYDPKNANEYIKLLNDLKPDKLELQRHNLAKRYAYYFFFEKMIYLEDISHQGIDNKIKFHILNDKKSKNIDHFLSSRFKKIIIMMKNYNQIIINNHTDYLIKLINFNKN